jgi:hypothetical protein
MMSRIDSWHQQISTGCHFQNGCHNTAQIQHCSISTGQCWICAVLWRPFWKWRQVEIFQCRDSIRDIIIYPHIKFLWYRTMLNFSGHFKNGDWLWCPEFIPDIEKFLAVAIFKMTATIPHKFNIVRFQRHFICVEFLPPIFYAVFWQPFWKWQTSWKFWKCKIAPLMVTYHYVKFYVSIIIQLEVININVSVAGLGDFIIVRL